MKTGTFRMFKSLPSFILGAASVIDIGNTINIFNIYKNPLENDYCAITSDWNQTGQDIRKGMMEFSQKYEYQ